MKSVAQALGWADCAAGRELTADACGEQFTAFLQTKSREDNRLESGERRDANGKQAIIISPKQQILRLHSGPAEPEQSLY